MVCGRFCNMFKHQCWLLWNECEFGMSSVMCQGYLLYWWCKCMVKRKEWLLCGWYGFYI